MYDREYTAMDHHERHAMVDHEHTTTDDHERKATILEEILSDRTLLHGIARVLILRYRDAGTGNVEFPDALVDNVTVLATIFVQDDDDNDNDKPSGSVGTAVSPATSPSAPLSLSPSPLSSRPQPMLVSADVSRKKSHSPHAGSTPTSRRSGPRSSPQTTAGYAYHASKLWHPILGLAALPPLDPTILVLLGQRPSEFFASNALALASVDPADEAAERSRRLYTYSSRMARRTGEDSVRRVVLALAWDALVRHFKDTGTQTGNATSRGRRPRRTTSSNRPRILRSYLEHLVDAHGICSAGADRETAITHIDLLRTLGDAYAFLAHQLSADNHDANSGLGVLLYIVPLSTDSQLVHGLGKKTLPCERGVAHLRGLATRRADEVKWVGERVEMFVRWAVGAL